MASTVPEITRNPLKIDAFCSPHLHTTSRAGNELLEVRHTHLPRQPAPLGVSREPQRHGRLLYHGPLLLREARRELVHLKQSSCDT